MTRPADQQPLSPRSALVTEARTLVRATGRREAGRFLVEGPQAVREAVVAGVLERVFATASAAQRHHDLPVDHVVDERTMAALTDAVTPQGIVGVARLVTRPVAEAVPAAARLVVVLVEPRDPGNVGTIIRTADAAGADAVVIAGDAVDVHNGKVVRATAGSLFHLPIGVAAAIDEVFDVLRSRGLRALAADGRAARDLADVEREGLLSEATAWVFGTEAHGLAADVVAACDSAVAVPLHGRAESLNLAAAAAVCVYASARSQRWQTSSS